MHLRNLFPLVLFLISTMGTVSSVFAQSNTTGGLPSSIIIGEDTQNVLFIPNSTVLPKFNIFKIFDMDRDGYADLILQAYNKESGQRKAIIYYGAPKLAPCGQFPESGLRKLVLNLQGTGGGKPNDYMTGDVNGDGLTDLIFNGTFIVRGEQDWVGERVISVNSPGVIKIYTQNLSGIESGASLDCVADINNDGIADIISSTITDRYTSLNYAVQQMHILYGARNLPSSINLSTTDLKSLRVLPDTLFGTNFSGTTTGDLDNDGFPEIITQVGIYRYASYDKIHFNIDSYMDKTDVIYGSLLNSSQAAEFGLDAMDRKSGIVPILRYPKKEWYGTGRDLYEFRNTLVSGDMNADGFDDLFMAFHNIDESYGQVKMEHDYAEIFLLCGKNEFLWSGDVNQLNDAKFVSAEQDDGLGYTMHMGDINGDGYGDLLLGSYQNYAIDSYINIFSVVYGGKNLPDSMTIGGDEFARGISVAGGRLVGAGDVNGDGYDDIVGNSNSGPFILFGRGQQYSMGETIVRDMPRSAESKYNYNFTNTTGFHFNFIKGQPGYFSRLSLTNFGKSLPDSLSAIPLGDGSGIIALISAELTDMPSTLSMQCSFSYSDSIILEAGIAEEDLSVSCWDDDRDQWSKVPSTLDTVANRITFLTDHLSLWALVDVNNSIVAAVDDLDDAGPLNFKLSQNYPNPFNPGTTIKYQVSQSSEVTLRIYSILGQEVRTLINRRVAEGRHEIAWDGTNNLGRAVSSGVYICRMTTSEGFTDSKKMLLLR